MLDDLICPIMSRPVVYPPLSGIDGVDYLFEVFCMRERCAMWQRWSEVPHCGLLGGR